MPYPKIRLAYRVIIDNSSTSAWERYISEDTYRECRLQNVLGSTFLPSVNYKFNIINSDITDSSKHKIGITLYSPLLTYLGIINNCYLVSLETQVKEGYEALMFAVQPQLSICYYEDGQINDLEKQPIL
ncbi:hypothetical protein [Flavobacterium sp. AG291]|uniref:hypothetical protein n=1 Tax=Flavobacterium sp. AG291 TaxID=2184000 RepID=UPI000E0A37A2|nr:hypothetical protein [Flavobacterium sp. AG291]RDI12203.1 hypothetical protein DEU42_104137 [Flavobacterium sp. AG291]